MRKFALLLVSTAGLMVLSNTAVLADEPQATTDAAQATQTTDPDKMVCKSMDPPTGSRLGARRECHTQREWDDRTRQDQSNVSHAQGMGYQMHQTPGH